jgi:hypothetical protein
VSRSVRALSLAATHYKTLTGDSQASGPFLFFSGFIRLQLGQAGPDQQARGDLHVQQAMFVCCCLRSRLDYSGLISLCRTDKGGGRGKIFLQTFFFNFSTTNSEGKNELVFLHNYVSLLIYVPLTENFTPEWLRMQNRKIYYAFYVGKATFYKSLLYLF